MKGHLFRLYLSHCLGRSHMNFWAGTLDLMLIHCFEDAVVLFRPACTCDQVDFFGQVEGFDFSGLEMIVLTSVPFCQNVNFVFGTSDLDYLLDNLHSDLSPTDHASAHWNKQLVVWVDQLEIP